MWHKRNVIMAYAHMPSVALLSLKMAYMNMSQHMIVLLSAFSSNAKTYQNIQWSHSRSMYADTKLISSGSAMRLLVTDFSKQTVGQFLLNYVCLAVILTCLRDMVTSSFLKPSYFIVKFMTTHDFVSTL